MAKDYVIVDSIPMHDLRAFRDDAEWAMDDPALSPYVRDFMLRRFIRCNAGIARRVHLRTSLSVIYPQD